VLGASTQTITVANEARANATGATVFGPFYVEGSPEVPFGVIPEDPRGAGRRPSPIARVVRTFAW
jgi:hypothetical protein